MLRVRGILNTMQVVYIAGPFRSSNSWQQEQNIRAAEAVALEVWRRGMVALCPHLNTRNFQGAAPDEVWLHGHLELLSRCDAVLLVPGWESSEGAKREIEFAAKRGIPVFRSLESLQNWAATM